MSIILQPQSDLVYVPFIPPLFYPAFISFSCSFCFLSLYLCVLALTPLQHFPPGFQTITAFPHILTINTVVSLISLSSRPVFHLNRFLVLIKRKFCALVFYLLVFMIAEKHIFVTLNNTNHSSRVVETLFPFLQQFSSVLNVFFKYFLVQVVCSHQSMCCAFLSNHRPHSVGEIVANLE